MQDVAVQKVALPVKLFSLSKKVSDSYKYCCLSKKFSYTLYTVFKRVQCTCK